MIIITALQNAFSWSESGRSPVSPSLASYPDLNLPLVASRLLQKVWVVKVRHALSAGPAVVNLLYPALRYMVDNTAMRTSDLARNAGVNLQTIRFYERQGLLPKPARTASGYRSYQQSDLERVLFIKRNQEIGFTLVEIKQLINLHGVLASMASLPFRKRPRELQGIIEIGRERLASIKQKSEMLKAMRRQLEWLLQQLESANVVTCPVQSSKRPKNPKKSS